MTAYAVHLATLVGIYALMGVGLVGAGFLRRRQA